MFITFFKISKRGAILYMKVAFIYGMKIKKDNKGNFYSAGDFNLLVWERYMSYGTSLIVPAIISSSNDHKNSFNDEKSANLVPKNINIVKLPNLRKNLKTYFSIKERKKQKKLIIKTVINSDFVIIRLPSTIGNIAVKTCKRYKKPYLIEVVGDGFKALWYHSVRGKILAPISYYKMKGNVRNSKYVIYVTSEYLQKIYPSKGKSISCSDVTIKTQPNEVLNERLKKINNINDIRSLSLMTIGTLGAKYKGQSLVIKELYKLNKRGYNFTYTLVGGGNSKRLRKLVKKYNLENNVIFKGEVHHDKVIEMLKETDVYVQPSKTEGLPRTVIEAMSVGCYVIGTNVGGIPELLNEKNLFEYNKPSDFSQILTSLTKEIMTENAVNNFNKSKKHDIEILENKRTKFINDFKQENFEF